MKPDFALACDACSVRDRTIGLIARSWPENRGGKWGV